MMRILSIISLGVLVLAFNSFSQGNEDFTNIPTTSPGNYLSRTWTGSNSVTWNATSARTDQTLTGKAICTNTSGSVTSPSYANGVGTLQFNYVRGFTGTGTRTIQVFVNGNQIGSNISVNATSSTIQNYNQSINIPGSVVIELRTSGAQIIIDDISWTAASSCTAPSTQASLLNLTAPLSSGLTANWTAVPSESSLLVVRPTAQGVATPVSGTPYTANTDYTSAEQINFNNRVVYASTSNSVSVIGLNPQTSYTTTAYAYSASTNCYNTTSAPAAAIMTLSEAVTNQASSVSTSNSTTTSIDLTIGAATFPASGATRAGYVIIYSTDTPTFTAANGTLPTAGVGTIFTTASTTLPTAPSTSVTVTGLSANSTYNFLVIPYTWDGINASTYNYLTASAPTANGSTTNLSAPVINTPTATSIINTLATLGGTVISDGGDAITERGIVWSLSAANPSPTIGGIDCTTLTTSGTTGVYTINVTSLPTGSTIAYVAYATNSLGTTYTSTETFVTNSPATRLVFGTNPPATGNVGLNLTAFTVEARRVDNSVDTEYTGTIEISQLSGSGLIAGTTSLSASAGIATFNAVQFNQASTYTIQGTASGLTSTSVSNSIVITIADDAVGEWINAAGATAWYTTTNWSNNTFPTGAMFARFNNTGTATTCGVNVNTANPSIMGIEVSALRTRALSIGASVTTTGTMTLNGGLNNQLPNTIIRNNSNSLLSFVPNISSSGSLNIVLGNATENVVRIDGTGNVAISSIISGMNRNLTKAGVGSGKLILSGNNTYTGETRINTGTIEINANERIDNTSNLVLNGGEFSTGATTGNTETMGTLNVASNSTINLGTGIHTLTFAPSNGEVWNGSSLIIFGWTGTSGITGTAGKVFVGTSGSDLTAAQLAKISFNGFAGNAIQLSTGEIVPQPFGPTNAVLSGTNTICAGENTDLAVSVTGGTAPFTVVYNDGTSDITVSNYTSDDNISVSPSSTTTYTLVSVTDAFSNPSDAVSGSAILTVNNPTSSSETVTTCDSYTWTANGTTYTTSGTYTATLINTVGCDSIATLNLTINTVGIVSNVSSTNVTSSTALVTWNSISVPIGGNFTIQYRLVGAPAWTTAGTASVGATSFQLTGLTQASNYEVQVAANCSAQSAGTYSSSHLFVTTSAGCSNPMVFNTPSVGFNSITTTWTAVPGTAWYEFQYKTTASGSWISGGTLAGTGTTKTFTGLLSSTSYDVRGRTFCPNGTASAWSIIVTATTGAAPACSFPPVLAVSNVTSSTATIAWPAIAGTSWFAFEYKQTTSGTWLSGGTVTGTATTKTFFGLTAATAYDIRVRSFCPNGTPSAWTTIQATTTSPTGCELPPVLTASPVLATTATITWPAVTGASWFEFRYKETASGTWLSAGTLTGTGTTKTYTGLIAGTQYDFEAKSFCANGLPSAWSTTLQFTTAMAMPLQPKPGTDVAEDKALENTNIDVNVYPNPTSDLVNIETIFEEADAAILVKVIDMNGRTVLEMNSLSVQGKNAIQLSLENLNVGIYNLELYNNNVLIDRSKVIKTN